MSNWEKPAGGDAAAPTKPATDFKRPGITNRKLALKAPTPGVKDRFAILQLGWYDGNPRFTVFTGDPDDAPEIKGRISANMDVPTFYAVIEAIEMATTITLGQEYRYIVDNYSTTDDRGQRLEKKSKVSETIIGVDPQGRIFLSVTAEGRPKIKFQFGSNDWHHWRDAITGEPVNEAQVSKLYAKGYVNFLRTAIAATAVAEGAPAPKPAFQRSGGGGGGGGGWKGNGGGGGGGGWKGNNGGGGGWKGGQGGGGGNWKGNGGGGQGGGGGGGWKARDDNQRPANNYSRDESAGEDIPF